MNMLQPVRRVESEPVSKIGQGDPGRSASRRRRLGWVALPLLLIAGGYAWTQRAAPVSQVAAMPIVQVAVPLQKKVTLWDDYIGRFEASRTVEVRPRVSGQITAIHFTDGQTVRVGQPLFTIDPRPFEAALAEARAGVAAAQSDVAIARTDLDRALRLVAAEAVAQSEVDRLKARVESAQAALAAAQARVRARALDVDFTTVRAPIGGRISNRRIDAGNLVSAGEGTGATLLTTINALDPIYFSFDGSEALFLKAKRAGALQAAPVEIKLQDETDYRWKGRLDFTDNGLDPRSGTIRARAVLENKDMFLTPGMFGNMRLSNGGTVTALLVPDTAVQTDQTRKMLLTVGKDGTVAAKPVVLGPVIAGLRVIRSGLAPDDRVIIAGTQIAAPGGKVDARPGKIAPEASTAPLPESGMAAAGQASFAL
ncbi:MAG TPA: efflux RND transporter periplasmic adaptor subunit [Sphingobium sp.]|nr:efflux RND transporter periplasmic adaptor subunit [Sphingobium sp.]